LCETTSVNWRFLQPLLQPFLDVSDLLFNFFLFTFSRVLAGTALSAESPHQHMTRNPHTIDISDVYAQVPVPI
jgi:hypothetical protein